MTLTTVTVKVQYAGDGSNAGPFSVPYKFWDDDDLKVILTVNSTNVDTPLVRGTHYTVAGGNGSTGSITMVTSPNDNTPATGETLTIKSNLLNLQDTALPAGGEFPSASVEQELDQIVRLIQQGDEKLGRALVLQEGTAFEDVTVPDPVAGETLIWDPTGLFLINATPTSGGSLTLPVVIAEGGTAATTAAAARTNLGLDGFAAAQSLALFHHGDF